MTDRARYHAVSAHVRAFLSSARAQESPFVPSELEAWLGWETNAFFDEGLLASFRRNFLGSGTMNWPNRRAEQERYVDTGGMPVKNTAPRPSAVRRHYQDVRGWQHLAMSFRRLCGVVPSPWRRAISDNLVGRPFHLRLPTGRVLTEPVVRHGYYLGRLGAAGVLPASGRLVVLEIGAGYGGLARLVRRASPGVVSLLIDLPQRLNLQAYYLTRSFPDARVVAADDPARVGEALGGGADFVLLPPWGIDSVPDGAVDLVVNTHSMQEMRPDQVSFYVGHVARVCRGHFYCVNRYEKQIGAAVVRHPREALSGWTTVYEAPQWQYPAILEGLYAVRG